jgi:hypothetical protein
MVDMNAVDHLHQERNHIQKVLRPHQDNIQQAIADGACGAVLRKPPTLLVLKR